MTQKEKDLLFKDLCARLPYGVKVHAKYIDTDTYVEVEKVGVLSMIDTDIVVAFTTNDDTNCYNYVSIHEVKPYLRPMFLMTKEEKEELKNKCFHTETEEDWEGVRCDVWGIQILKKYDARSWDNPIWPSTINMDAIDWLNRHHFDYRGLIGKNLALDATGLNIY